MAHDGGAEERFMEELKKETSFDLIARIESTDFTSPVGPLRNRLEWQELKRRLLQQH